MTLFQKLKPPFPALYLSTSLAIHEPSHVSWIVVRREHATEALTGWSSSHMLIFSRQQDCLNKHEFLSFGKIHIF